MHKSPSNKVGHPASARVCAMLIALLSAGCSSVGAADGPHVAEWTDAEHKYVDSLRENEPGRFTTDEDAAQWITAGRAACSALQEGLPFKSVSSVASDAVNGEKFTREDLLSSAETLCPENVHKAADFAFSREAF